MFIYYFAINQNTIHAFSFFKQLDNSKFNPIIKEGVTINRYTLKNNNDQSEEYP